MFFQTSYTMLKSYNMYIIGGLRVISGDTEIQVNKVKVFVFFFQDNV